MPSHPISFYYLCRSSKWALSFRVSVNILLAISLSSFYATCSVHLFLFELVKLITYGKNTNYETLEHVVLFTTPSLPTLWVQIISSAIFLKSLILYDKRQSLSVVQNKGNITILCISIFSFALQDSYIL
jgi:hypothetical protein